MRNILEVKNLVRSYNTATFRNSKNNVNVLKGISFQVAEGEFVGIMGKSGCGKTTLLKTLGMIDKPTDGTIKFMGEDTSELYGDKLADIRNSKIGFIFQDFYLMDSLSVEENIMLPMIISKQNINKMIAEAKKYAEQFQIEHLLKKNPYELSGGEKQRVAICRALINNPDLILADEPTGNLDSKSGKIVIDALNKISSEYKKTIVMVTHDPQMASYCDRIILLKDGKILEERYQEMLKSRKVVHDMKNHILALKNYDQEQNWPGLHEYLNELSNDMLEYNFHVWTGNHMLDMILNQKEKDAQNQNTVMQIDTEVFSTLPFTDREIISLFWNLLDNALEACEKINDKERWIKIKIKKKNLLLYIEIANALEEMPKQIQKEFVSNKKDNGLHGYGMKNIQDIVKKYDGIFEYKVYEDHLIFMISIYNN